MAIDLYLVSFTFVVFPYTLLKRKENTAFEKTRGTLVAGQYLGLCPLASSLIFFPMNHKGLWGSAWYLHAQLMLCVRHVYLSA